jgi:hypothetical protein
MEFIYKVMAYSFPRISGLSYDDIINYLSYDYKELSAFSAYERDIENETVMYCSDLSKVNEYARASGFMSVSKEPKLSIYHMNICDYSPIYTSSTIMTDGFATLLVVIPIPLNESVECDVIERTINRDELIVKC